MTEQLTIYEVGERFGTISRDGVASVYEVSTDGCAVAAPLLAKHRYYQSGPDGEYTCTCGHPGKTRGDWDRHYYQATKG